MTKRRVNAFHGTDLEPILRARDIESLVLTGIATRGVILSTLRYAADADYDITVLRDCSGDPDPEVQAVLMDKIFPMQATISDAEAFIKAIG